LVRDLPSLVAALLEDNRRRTEAGRKPVFIVDGDRVTLVEFPPPTALLEEAQARAPHVGARPLSANQLGTEVRRAVIRALRRRVSELDTSAFENLCAALLERMGMRDVRVAKRSKEGPLYLARPRRRRGRRLRRRSWPSPPPPAPLAALPSPRRWPGRRSLRRINPARNPRRQEPRARSRARRAAAAVEKSGLAPPARPNRRGANPRGRCDLHRPPVRLWCPRLQPEKKSLQAGSRPQAPRSRPQAPRSPPRHRRRPRRTLFDREGARP